jgi:hypothetical protein
MFDRVFFQTGQFYIVVLFYFWVCVLINVCIIVAFFLKEVYEACFYCDFSVGTLCDFVDHPSMN